LTPDHLDLHAHFSYPRHPCHPCHPWSNSLFWGAQLQRNQRISTTDFTDFTDVFQDSGFTGKGLTPDHPDLHAHFSYPRHPCHPWSNSLFWGA
jgi:hypothetical protein